MTDPRSQTRRDPVRVDVIAPSGSVLSWPVFEQGMQRMRALGWRVRSRVPPEPWMRFSDTDDGRLEQIHAAARATDVDAVMIVRGGYGLSRLLDRIDWNLLAASVRRGVRWIGFSDFTALQLGLLARTEAVSFAGPVVAGDLGAESVHAGTLEKLQAFLQSGRLPVLQWEDDGAEPGLARRLDNDLEGTLWGGNLAMIASLVGTPWLPQIDDGLLFVEDVGEHPYRVERLLLQLHHAGILRRQRALLFGAFTEWRPAPHDNGYDLAEVARCISDCVGIPVVQGLPFGHVPGRAILGVGLRYRLRRQHAEWELGPVRQTGETGEAGWTGENG